MNEIIIHSVKGRVYGELCRSCRVYIIFTLIQLSPKNSIIVTNSESTTMKKTKLRLPQKFWYSLPASKSVCKRWSIWRFIDWLSAMWHVTLHDPISYEQVKLRLTPFCPHAQELIKKFYRWDIAIIFLNHLIYICRWLYINSMETSSVCCAFLALLLLPHAGRYFLLSLFSLFTHWIR